MIVLRNNTWDDYSFKTSFLTDCQVNSESVDIGTLKILIEGHQTTSAFLDASVAAGWNGEFPIPDANYISNPAGISFYEQLVGRLPLHEATHVAVVLRDASYLVKAQEDEAAIKLINSDGFKNSLQREQGLIKAFLDGWKLLSSLSITVENQSFCFRSSTGDLVSIDLRFSSSSPLPHDINVIIGPNGVGKSQLLKQMVDCFLSPGSGQTGSGATGFAVSPNVSQVVVVSYSPFELFPVDTADFEDLRDAGFYKYFGFRGRKKYLTEGKRGSDAITLSREFPKANAAQSLIACLADDQRYDAVKDWSKKLETMEVVLGSAFDFDSAAIVLSDETSKDDVYARPAWGSDPRVEIQATDEDDGSTTVMCLPISSSSASRLKLAGIKKHTRNRSGVIFLKDGQPIKLSSGQRLFCYIVINILGAIRRNSLILVDEPELFLHPTLEVAFIGMLKSILKAYSSKALVATHSLVTVRETPRDCVHVFERTKEGLVVKTPPFETFGGDMQRISSYVFGDKSVAKPYEAWVKEQLEVYGSSDNLIEALGKDINEELIIQISLMGAKKW